MAQLGNIAVLRAWRTASLAFRAASQQSADETAAVRRRARREAAMYGPMPKGHWTGHLPIGPFKHLEVGARYVVAREFVDHDKDVHPVGETWTYLGHNFVPYHDGLSLFVSLDGVNEWQIRLQWIPEEQAAVIDALEDHVHPAARA
jgi:hypothetical protein